MGKMKEMKPVADQVGFSTLNTISSADRFNRWMYEKIAPFCTGAILEIGGGIGNISRFFLEAGKKLTITELHDEYCEIVKSRLSDFPGLGQVICMDITDPAFDSKFKHLYGRYETIIALNVIEHIGDRDLALSNCRKLLHAGGTLVILVPAFQSLFNRFDTNLGHYLRFRKKTLCALMERNGFSVFHRSYFNAAGIAGWWFTGSVLKKNTIPEGQMGLYNFLVPLFRFADKLFSTFAGLSVVAAGKKKEQP